MKLDHRDYCERMRTAVQAILDGHYEAFERRARQPHEQRSVGMRSFWNGMKFEDVRVAGEYPDTELIVILADELGGTGRYGFRGNIWQIAARWEQVSGTQEMRNDPDRLAHEMVFVMVYTIADAPPGFFRERRVDDVAWLTPADVWSASVGNQSK